MVCLYHRGFDWEYETPGACNTFDLANTNPSLHAEALSLLTPPNLDDRCVGRSVGSASDVAVPDAPHACGRARGRFGAVHKHL